ncbi:MAG: ribosomal protein L3 N(5)-glutamine methyltransferase [Gammaproteobacteria bacterium RIFCSPHIGHO2_12_FULL_38_14]|nr:MAG: ribosomal protein L3 N(5)-glutamine methyltransferase [Gammaproteobacteria bacterium RIFCSPHIGHO2_12_FULL_38_14]
MTAYKELKTIRDFIRFAVSRFNEAGLFYGHGTDNAWDEALALVFPALHLPHHIHTTLLDANLTKVEREKLLFLISKRINERIPVPYLTHESWFAGLSFYIDERVLIPRSPIAELIENHFEPWVNLDAVENILDLCTGSGCIAIACAKQFPHAHVDASDISHDALSVARINILRHSVEDQVSLFESDLFSSLPEKKYDLIVSNPPYVNAPDMSSLPAEFLHEPQIGLMGGLSGLDIALKILKNANPYLQDKGLLIVEVGNSETALIELFPDVPFTWLSFERGGDGVLMLTKEQLTAYQSIFSKTSVES